MGGAGLLRRRPGRRLGVSRASLYRALDALAGRGVLRREGRRVQVLQPDALEQN